MKVSVSVPATDVAYLDEYARAHALGSRSAAVQRAVEVLRLTELGAAYADAWGSWEADGDAEAWEPTAADGL